MANSFSRVDITALLPVYYAAMGQQLRTRVKRKARTRRKKRLKERAAKKSA